MNRIVGNVPWDGVLAGHIAGRHIGCVFWPCDDYKPEFEIGFKGCFWAWSNMKGFVFIFISPIGYLTIFKTGRRATRMTRIFSSCEARYFF
jgi:hypothetical protein